MTHLGLSVVRGIRATLESLGSGGKGWLWRHPPLSHIGRGWTELTLKLQP